MSRRFLFGLMLNQLFLAGIANHLHAQDLTDQKRERLKDDAADFWIYDDIDAAYKLAADNGKPMLISFRCVP